MKTGVSTAFKNHLAQMYQSTCTCWKITLNNATVKGFTDHDTDIVFSGVTYLAASGYTASNVVSSGALNVDQLEVQGMLQDPSITENDLRAGLWDYAAVEIFLVNWADLSMGRLIQRVGTLGEVSTDRGFFKAELRGLAQAFSRMIGELTSPGCRASLGDARCGVTLSGGSPNFTVTGSATTVRADNMTFFDTARSEAGPTPTSTINLIQPYGVDSTTFVLPSAIFPDLQSGGVVAVYGMTGAGNQNAHINGLWIVRNVSSVTANLSFTIKVVPPFGAQPNPVGTVAYVGNTSGYFDFGVVTWTSGLNVGLSMEVKNYAPTLITLALPMPFAIQVGDTYSMHAGCDKQLATCRDRFNNVIRFRGEPYLPGVDKVVQVARRQ